MSKRRTFGDFGRFRSESVAIPLTTLEPQAHLDLDDDDDFGDFGSFEQAQDPNQSSNVEQVDKQMQTAVLDSLEQAGQNEDDDYFGDFGGFTYFNTDEASQDF